MSFLKSKPIIVFILILLGSFTVAFAQEAVEWVGGYSSQEWEGGESDAPEDFKIYYQWQIDSLKKAVSPRYIRLLDIHKYASTGNLLNKGILFTYTGFRTKSVSLCGNFNNWQCVPMRKNNFGIFYILVPPTSLNSEYEQLTQYKYKFKADGLYEIDQENPETADDGGGSLISLFHLEKSDPNKMATTQVLEDSPMEEAGLRTVVFQVYEPDKQTVSIAGNFNNWSVEADYLEKKPNGIFELKMKLLPGVYHYQFIADGEVIVDTYNPNVRIREPFGELVSEIIVPERTIPLERKF